MSKQTSKTKGKASRGFDLPLESYYILQDKWRVNKDCKTPPEFNKLKALYDELLETTDKKEAVKTRRQCTKEILELTLSMFNYEKALANHGYITLDNSAIELAEIFLKDKLDGRDQAAYYAGRGTERYVDWFKNLEEEFEIFKLYTHGIGTLIEIHTIMFDAKPTKEQLIDYTNILRGHSSRQ